jgi:hypothetical protein
MVGEKQKKDEEERENKTDVLSGSEAVSKAIYARTHTCTCEKRTQGRKEKRELCRVR